MENVIVSKVEYLLDKVVYTPTYKIEESTSASLIDSINDIYNIGLGQWVISNISNLELGVVSIEDWFTLNGANSWVANTEVNYDPLLPSIQNINELL